MDDRYNDLYVLRYIERENHNNRMICLGEFQGGKMLCYYSSEQLIKINILTTDRVITYIKYESNEITDKAKSR